MTSRTSSTTANARPIVADRFAGFGVTIFAEMSRLAQEHDAINLGQGFPNFDGPDFIKQAAQQAMHDGANQYAPTGGVPQLAAAIADFSARFNNLPADPATEITVTSGCTEALADTFLGLVNPGDEVILFEPYYDTYRACVALAGATARYVTLHPPDFTFDVNELRNAFTDRTRAVLINTPHNPTGHVFTRDELQLIASLCIEYDCLAFTDEVYERLVYEGEHIPLATIDGMRQRTVTMSSLGKTFSLTGWKIGWAIAPPELTAGVRAAHQYITFSTATPLQHGAAAALRADDDYFTELAADYRRKRDVLYDGLIDIGFKAQRPGGGYFIMADHTPFGFDDDVAFCRHLIEHIGVAAIPPSVFYDNPQHGRHLVRFAFCKDDQTLHDALERLGRLTNR